MKNKYTKDIIVKGRLARSTTTILQKLQYNSNNPLLYNFPETVSMENVIAHLIFSARDSLIFVREQNTKRQQRAAQRPRRFNYASLAFCCIFTLACLTPPASSIHFRCIRRSLVHSQSLDDHFWCNGMPVVSWFSNVLQRRHRRRFR